MEDLYLERLKMNEREIEERKKRLENEHINIRFWGMKRVQENRISKTWKKEYKEEYEEYLEGNLIKNPLIQAAEAISELKKITNWSNKIIAKEIKTSERQIYNYLRILNISKKIKIENKNAQFREILKNFPKETMYNHFKKERNQINKDPQIESLIYKIFYIKKLLITKKRSEEFNKKQKILQTNRWQDEEYRKKQLKAILHGLIKRPTSFELKIFNLCIKYNLPFFYTGNGTFLIGNKNPDFVNENDKIVIEVFFSWYKIRDYGSIENYEKQRSEYFAKYGWKVIFIDEIDLNRKNWERVCLNKIKCKEIIQ